MIVAIVAPIEPASFFDLVWQGAWEATFDVSPFGVDVQNLTTESYDVDAQQTILTELLGRDVDAIALVPAHASALNDLIRDHVARGTPVIIFHSDAPESGRTLFVGPDPLQGGVLAGEVLSKMMGGRGRLLSFPGSLEKYHIAQRYEGLRQELKRQHPELEEIEAGAQHSAIAEILRSAGSIQGIYVGSDEMTDVALALEELGIQVPCVGFTHTDDVAPFLERRTVSAVIDDSRYRQGYFAIQKAYEAVVRKGGTPPSGVSIPCTVVFSSNARDSGGGQSLNEAFEALVLQRTESLRSSQTMLEEANRKLESLATTDALTGLYNRRKFDEMLEQEVRRVQRVGTISLLMIDLNWFKIVNDKYGHQAGDEALKAVAEVLRSRCRNTDVCARLGGDEFAVMLPLTGQQEAKLVRDSINGLIAKIRLPVGTEELSLSLSIGISTLSGAGATVQQLLALADQDMYHTKSVMKKGEMR